MTAKTKTMDITLNRTIPASPGEVYDAWLDVDNPGTPWHDSSKVILPQPKVDGMFYFNKVSKQGENWAHFGRFINLERGVKIEYSWMSTFTRGLESVVTVELQKKGEDTLLQLRHANLPDDDFGRLHDEGWNQLVEILAKGFQGGKKR
jgi:uncharacterized protein YndB with AHSA1/START domain